MKKKSGFVLIGVSLIILILLGVYSRNRLSTVNRDEITLIKVTIVNEESTSKKRRTATVYDLHELDSIVIDLNAVITGEKLHYIIINKITHNSHYTIELYQDDKIIKKYTLYERSLTEGFDSGKKYEVPKKDDDLLINLKNHLSVISQ